jgi:hypothetical protein
MNYDGCKRNFDIKARCPHFNLFRGIIDTFNELDDSGGSENEIALLG